MDYKQANDFSYVDTEADDHIIAQAHLSQNVKGYWFVSGIILNFILVFAFIGVLTLPLWLIFGYCILDAYYPTVEIILTPRALLIRKGGILGNCVSRVEKTILLDR